MYFKHGVLAFVVIANAAYFAQASEEFDEEPPAEDTETAYGAELPEHPDETQGSGEGVGVENYRDSDILLVSWVPFPVDKWDYAILNMSDPEYVKESGRASLASFTSANYPDVTVVFACAPKDRDYFYNYDLDVPVIGVDPFQNDKIFLEYLDRIYTIHGFQNPTELWAHFIGHSSAFLPVMGRLSEEFQTYLENWKPRGTNPYDGYPYQPYESRTGARPARK